MLQTIPGRHNHQNARDETKPAKRGHLHLHQGIATLAEFGPYVVIWSIHRFPNERYRTLAVIEDDITRRSVFERIADVSKGETYNAQFA